MASLAMTRAGRTGHGVRAESVTFYPQALRAGSTMRLCEAGARLSPRDMSAAGGNVLRFRAASEPPSNGRAPRRRYDSRERRSDYGCPKCGQALHRLARPRAPAGAACALRARRRLPRLAVARPRHADGLRRRAPLRQALAVYRCLARPLDPPPA